MVLKKTTSSRDTHVYQLSNKKGQALYFGITNNLERRESEHRKKKIFSKMISISKAKMTKPNAEKLERKLIRTHKKSTGSTPKLNVSTTGQYEYGAMKSPTKKKQILSKIKSIKKVVRGKKE
jgi:predicted GIY-YIG superfamily endonuclease